MSDHGIIEFPVGRDLESRLDCKLPDENGKSAKHMLLDIRQQVIAPVQHGVQRLVSRKSRPSALPDDFEPVVEQFCSTADPKRPNPTCHEFDSESYAVKPATNVCHDRHIGV